MRPRSLWKSLLVAGLIGLTAMPVSAAEIVMKSGFEIEGRLGKTSGLAENPLKPDGGAGEIKNSLIVLADDGLRRTFVCTYQLREAMGVVPGPALTRIKVNQRVADGKTRRIGMVGPIIGITPWDKFGRRIFEMQTAEGPLKIVQGITEITPVWTRVEGLMSATPYQWDMRIATSSVPRNVLSSVLMSQIDPKDIDQRRQIVKLYIESDRYQDASTELTGLIKDFPALKKELGDLDRDLKQMSARRLLKEVEVRQAAGQDRLAQEMLKKFPTEGVAGVILGEVAEKLAKYDTITQQGKDVLEKLNKNIELTGDPELRKRVEPLHEEIKKELNIHTLDRFADFVRLADSDTLKPEQKVSLALSNWLMGTGSSVENLAVSLSLQETRDLAREYLRSTRRDERAEILDKLKQQEGATPIQMAKLLAHMKPPVETDPAAELQTPGLFELTVPSFPGQADITYYVQLPPEYDPYKRYPAIVTLNGSNTTPLNQIDWWAGDFDDMKTKMRLGQATRRGYIVIAPAWSKKHQRKYEYTAPEHAAVLFSLRDACKRFSIDTDKVFLSGHSMGGDAAWDIALAHPDLWAGVLPIVATTGKYVARYWENGKQVPMYFVGGEMDGDRMSVNGRDLDRYLTKTGFDCVVVEYLGRGHEDFIDEIQRMFDWMGLHQRSFQPAEFNVSTMRAWDNFFWWVEVAKLPERSVVAPALFDEKAKDARPVNVIGRITPKANFVRLETGAGAATVFLSPETIDFGKHVTISVNTQKDIKQLIRPESETILEDVRTRGDRQHPFWAKVEVTTGKK